MTTNDTAVLVEAVLLLTKNKGGEEEGKHGGSERGGKTGVWRRVIWNVGTTNDTEYRSARKEERKTTEKIHVHGEGRHVEDWSEGEQMEAAKGRWFQPSNNTFEC